MKNKGFTLAELMGVIVILGILLLLVVPNVMENIKNSKDSSYNIQISNIKMAMQNWKEKNKSILPNRGETIYLTIGQLKKDNYLDNDMKDPKTGKMWPNDMLVSISNDSGYQYDVLTDTGTITEVYDQATPYLSFDTGDVVILNVGDTYLIPVVTLHKSDGSSQILVHLDPTISGTDTKVDTTSTGVYQVKYTYSYGTMTISSIQNVIIRNSSNINNG